VIKRIRAELLDDPRIVKMFLDEARLAASLHHHNIVQVNDIGEHAGAYFFAMEYVHGEDARRLLVNASERGAQIPIEHAITIACSAAAGLHHAHEQRGRDREPLGIVHRDVSPANLLVGFDGSVKVADFGIAFAAHRSEQTQAGTLKGKVAYMSPEQCNSERVDRRSDVFSLGICLYELVCVHPCFAGATDFQTMQSIVAGRYTPPSHYSAHVTPELAAIIAKALAVDAGDRYQSCDELRQALEVYAARAKLRTSTTALADYMKQQFGDKALPWQSEPVPAEEEDLELEIIAPLAPIVPDFTDEHDLAIPIAAAGEVSTGTPRAFATQTPTARITRVRRNRMLPWFASGCAALALVIAGVASATGETVASCPVIDAAPSSEPVAAGITAIAHESPVKTLAKHKRAKKPRPVKRRWDPNTLFPR
jgi:serine/threonine protein kinase